jgi:hypothetical protein
MKILWLVLTLFSALTAGGALLSLVTGNTEVSAPNIIGFVAWLVFGYFFYTRFLKRNQKKATQEQELDA